MTHTIHIEVYVQFIREDRGNITAYKNLTIIVKKILFMDGDKMAEANGKQLPPL